MAERDTYVPGIDAMERYRKARAELDAQEEIAKAYLEKVRADVEQDLSPLREEVSAARESIEAFVRGENGGEKFRVPGLGTAYLSRKRQTKIVDPEAVIEAADGYYGGQIEFLYNEPTPNKAACKKFAEDWMNDTGELVPGAESEEVETLNVRLG